jgi:hypothetical protein
VTRLRNGPPRKVFRIAVYGGWPDLGHRVGRGDFAPGEGRALPVKVGGSHRLGAQLEVVVGVHVDSREGVVAIWTQSITSAYIPAED